TRPGMSRAASMRRNVRTLRLVRWASPAMSISSLSVGEGTTSPVLPDRVGGKGTMSPGMGHLPGSALLGEPAGNPLAFPKLVLEAEGEVRRGQLAVGDIAPAGPRVETDSLPELFEGDVFPQPFDGGHLGWEAQGGAPVLRSAGRPGRLLNSLPRGRPGPWVPGRGTLALGGVGGGHGPLSFSRPASLAALAARRRGTPTASLPGQRQGRGAGRRAGSANRRRGRKTPTAAPTTDNSNNLRPGDANGPPPPPTDRPA